MNDRLQVFLDDLCQNYPDPDGLVVTSFNVIFIRDVSTHPSEYLSSVMLALNRFAGHVRFFGNEKRAEVKRLKRTLEGQKSITIANLEGVTSRTTDKARQAKAYAQNPELQALDDKIADAEYKALLVDGMDGIIQEHASIIKYELNRRYKQGQQI